jgi:Amt family ammonium transporter
MESHGIAGQIQINSSTYELIQDDFEITRRGEIEVKGKGTTTTYIVNRRKQIVT